MVYYIFTPCVCQFQISKQHFCSSTGVQMSSQNIHSIFGPNLFWPMNKLPIIRMIENHVEINWNFYSNIIPKWGSPFLTRIPPTALFWYDPCWLWERVSIRRPSEYGYSKDNMQSAWMMILANHKIDVSTWWRQDGNTWILFLVFILLFWDYFF